MKSQVKYVKAQLFKKGELSIGLSMASAGGQVMSEKLTEAGAEEAECC